MRIALISSWLSDVIGGTGTAVFLHTFVDGLRGLGHDVEVISPTLTATDYVTITLERLLFNSELNSDPRIQAADVIIGFDYDGFALDPKTSPPLITSVHAIFGDVAQWETGEIKTMVESQAFFDRATMHKSQRVTVGSTYGRSRLVALYDLDPAKIDVIYHGRQTPSWLNYVDSELRLPNARPTVLAVGAMYPRKRLDLLLNAVSMLRREFPDIDVRIVGNGIMWDALHELANDLGINTNVTWLSHIPDDNAFAREWRQADVFCHPSQQETFGFVYVEAMMLGKPIVAANASAAPEVIQDAGLLVEPDSPDAYAAAITRFLTEPALCAEKAALGRQRAAYFTVERMMAGYQTVIEGVL
jgi:glycosyltransferase involved in cell wall biosynthesis